MQAGCLGEWQRRDSLVDLATCYKHELSTTVFIPNMTGGQGDWEKRVLVEGQM